ncbi:Uncharacterised protein [Mycobacteroides abscessus subsp. abscessus]|nr:Uncharacterised protein [Mycobacteroides abscessus subsp. abscessus]
MVRSAIDTSTSPAPRSRASSRTRLAWGSSMSFNTIRAPSEANSCTIARPMLEAPPVTTTREPASPRSMMAFLTEWLRPPG